MNRLRDRLILLFLVATLAPLAATFWLTTSLLQQSLRYSTTRELDELSRALEMTGREFYQQSRESLRRDALAGLLTPQHYDSRTASQWPEPVREFWESGQQERFYLSGTDGDRLDFLVRRDREVLAWSRRLGAVAMKQLSRQYSEARKLVEAGSSRDLRRGFIVTFLVLALSTWLVSLGLLVFFAARVSRPIHDLTAGLRKVSGGDLEARVERAGDGKLAVEVHDSGPGLPPEARETLFEPTLSFKKGGMGLGLSIARRSALLSGGDIVLMEGELGGAAFRVTLPPA